MYPKEHELSEACWFQKLEAEIALECIREEALQHFVRGADGVLIDVTDGVKARELATIKRMQKALSLVGLTDG